MKVIVAGDYCENGRVTKFIEDEDYEHLFGSIKPIVSKADISIINLEFPIVSSSCNPINPVSQYYSIQEARSCSDYILVIVHGGIEGYQLPTPRMKEIYRYFVDVGADVVINGHQHCFSGFEHYKSGIIFYGLGNFLFDWDGKRNSLWNEGYFVELDFGDETIKSTIYPYTQSDEDASISLLNGVKKQQFNNRLDIINKTISNDNELKENLINFSCFNSKYEFKYLFSPYNNKYLNALMNKKLLPSSMWSEEKWFRLLNGIQCESHRERLLYYIKDYIKNK